VLDAQLGEAIGRLEPGVDGAATVERQVLGLVRQGIDVRARMVAGDDDAGRAGARVGGGARFVPAVEEEGVAGRDVRRVNRCAVVARLLEVVDARGGERVDEAQRRPPLRRRSSARKIVAPRIATSTLPMNP
jgi:hypothetical protein